MAKSKELTKDEQSAKNYEAWKKMHGMKGKKAEDSYKAVEIVDEAFNKARTARQNNCYWGSYADSQTSSQGGGGNWAKRWDKQDKVGMPWSQESSSDQFTSNVKSPMTRGRINAFLNQFKKLNLGWEARPNHDKDRTAANIATMLLSNWYQQEDVKQQLTLVAESAAGNGSAFFDLEYVKRVKKQRFPKTKGDTEDEKKRIEAGEVIYNDPIDNVVYEDPILTYVPIRDVYVDPVARCLHGKSYEARYVIVRSFISIDDFKQQYKDKPGAKNVDKVKPLHEYTMDEYDFFKKPSEVVDKDMVELRVYQNQDNDRKIVVANDMLILDTPLPNDHKEISLHKVDFLSVPGQLYGMGLADLLMQPQGSEEILINMLNDYIYRAYNPKWAVDARSFGEISEHMVREDAQLFPIDLTDGKGISQKLQQIVSSPIGFDAFKLHEIMERNGTLATQIDPTQMSLVSRGQTATANVLNKEQLESMIGGVIENFVNGGFLSAGRQVWKLMQQHYSIPKVKKILGKDDKEENEVEYRRIRLDGLEYEDYEDEETGTSYGRIKESDKEYSFLEVKPEMIATNEELTIRVRPDTLAIQSRGIEQQKMRELLPQLQPFMVDPDKTEQALNHPMGYINGPKFMQDYLEIEDINTDILISKEEDYKMQEANAEDHLKRIWRGEEVEGTPGAGSKHREIEAKVLMQLEIQLADAQSKVANDMASKEMKLQEIAMQMPPQFDPTTGQPIPPELPPIEPDPEMQKKVDELQDRYDRLQKHLADENMPAVLLEERAIDGPPQPPQPEGQPPMPPGQGGPMPDQMMMQGGGQAPMPQGPMMQDVMPGMGGVEAF